MAEPSTRAQAEQAEPPATPTRPPALPTGDLAAQAGRTLEAAVEALYTKQKPDGHWCAELEGDSILNSEYLLMKVILGQDVKPSPLGADESASEADLRLFGKLCEHMRRLQRGDGTWGQHPGAPADLSATVKAYYALKLFGEDTDAPHMRLAREAALDLGGAERCNTYSIFFLACLGQAGWDACPSVPPEVVLLPRWSPFHMDKVSAWTRTMILPLALCTALRPVRRLAGSRGCAELFRDPARRNEMVRDREANPFALSNLFLGADKALKVAQRLRLTPLRKRAMREAEAWVLDRSRGETTDGLGAIFPPMVYIQIALQSLGYARMHDARKTAERELDRFIVEEPDHARIQPCFSPVWDTGIALYALTEAGRTRRDERIEKTCEWLKDKQVRMVGDWARNLRARDRGDFEHSAGADPEVRAWTAWAFEYENDWYPDVDDTAMVAKALWRAGERDAPPKAVRWILAMQNGDGGWAAFDRTKDRAWMEKVPFADHNAMQDPSCSDITGRTIEALVTCGAPREHPAIRRAVAYLYKTQRDAGWWWGRWGVNAIYGAWQAVGGLHAAGEDMAAPALRKTLSWLRSVQQADGGFGESANSYLDESLVGKGPATASQTAWAATTLMYLAPPTDPAIERAIRWLCDTQLTAPAPAQPPAFLHEEPAGSWVEPQFTGTGFPKVFYLRYHLYRHYFPVMALGRYRNLRRRLPAG